MEYMEIVDAIKGVEFSIKFLALILAMHGLALVIKP